MGISNAVNGFVVPLLGVDVVITAYYYQLLILEIMAEMKNPKDFPKANYWVAPIVIFVAVICATFRYYFQGEQTVLNTSSIHDIYESIFYKGQTPFAYFGMTCFTIQMFGTCLIRAVILTRSMQLLIHPQSANKRTWGSRLEWAAISSVIMALVWTLSLFIRSRMYMAVVNGMLALLTSISLPIILYIVCCRRLWGKRKLTTMPEWILIAITLIGCVVVFLLFPVKYWYLYAHKKEMHMFYNDLSNSTRLDIDTYFDCSSGF